ncbi:MAG: hypothetical protein RL026_2174 [Pseudomonadota bacterium]|jgi:hypothetical protein
MTVLHLQKSPTQRMLAQGVLAITSRLVRAVATRQESRVLRSLMEERHRLLRELGSSVQDDKALDCLAAMTAAVIESDLALEKLLAH